MPVRFDLAQAEDLSGVSSMWARREIDSLLGYPHRDGGEEHKQAAIAIALQHRVMTEYTSFVAVDERGVVDPGTPTRTIEQALPLPQGTSYGGMGLVGTGRGGGGTSEGTIGLGNTGLIGKGGGSVGSGYASGHGAQFGGRSKPVPRVHINTADIQGSLDADVVRGIVRGHRDDLRKCYNTALQSNPSLAGTVVISFTISPEGKVTRSIVRSNDTGNDDVGTCIAKLAKGWTFPQGHGNVMVSYPFTLDPGS